jgi:uncharacterized protein with PQ loop repeat
MKHKLTQHTGKIVYFALLYLTVVLPYQLLNESWSNRDKPTISPMLWFLDIAFWIWLTYHILTDAKPESTRSKTIIDNRGATIQTQNNYAEKMVIKQTVNESVKPLKPMSQADKELLQEVYMKRGKYDEWKALELTIKIDADADKLSDSIKDTYQNVKIDDSASKDNSITSRQINPIHAATKPLTPNDAVISRVIRDKVYAKRDEVMALQHESPNYIARKVFDITGGGSRLKYIAAIEQLIQNEIERENF